MNAKKILFPTDFSIPGREALAYATALAKESGATLVIVHVAEPPSFYAAGEFYYGGPDPNVAELKRMLEQVVPADSAVRCEHHLLTGNPPEEITRFAAEEGVDMIVMSTHGRSGLGRVLMGSAAEVVVRHATCPVLTLKPAQAATVAATTGK